MLRVASLHEWYEVSDETKKRFTEGVDAIEEAYFHFFPPTTAAELSQQTTSTPKPSASNKPQTPTKFGFLKKFLTRKSEENTSPIAIDTLLRNEKLDLEKEVSAFSTLVTSEEFRSLSWNTKDFWLSHKITFPKLFKLARVLLNIPASTAFIERFFSICGIICKQRSMNMDDELFIARCIFKANINIFNELNQVFFEKPKK